MGDRDAFKAGRDPVIRLALARAGGKGDIREMLKSLYGVQIDGSDSSHRAGGVLKFSVPPSDDAAINF